MLLLNSFSLFVSLSFFLPLSPFASVVLGKNGGNDDIKETNHFKHIICVHFSGKREVGCV